MTATTTKQRTKQRTEPNELTDQQAERRIAERKAVGRVERVMIDQWDRLNTQEPFGAWARRIVHEICERLTPGR